MQLHLFYFIYSFRV